MILPSPGAMSGDTAFIVTTGVYVGMGWWLLQASSDRGQGSAKYPTYCTTQSSETKNDAAPNVSSVAIEEPWPKVYSDKEKIISMYLWTGICHPWNRIKNL